MKNVSRRNFVVASSGIAAGALLAPGLVQARSPRTVASKSGLVTGQPKPLRHTSIPGFLSAEQLAPHFSAHYGGALRGYLATDSSLESASKSGTSIDNSAFGAMQRTRVSKGNSVLLHELYFDGMALKKSNPKGKVKAAIIKRFGSTEKWATDFQACARSCSGWATLAFHKVNKKLYNVASDSHATGVLWMSTPLLVIDVYEHAYYLDYKNDKAKYIGNFMSHINWTEINRRYRAAK
jgi:Fe-Mn family superoxide dismutase